MPHRRAPSHVRRPPHQPVVADPQVDLKVQQLQERLQQDKLVVAFVAEFSRGKSELINALFFADTGRRVLPATPGRTTMCPVELYHDPRAPARLSLLPDLVSRLGWGIVFGLVPFREFPLPRPAGSPLS